MPSLKEVKTRINSVNSTRKITSAMKMVASSKLHHAQQKIEQMQPYERQLKEMMATLVGNLEGDFSSPLAQEREVKRVAIVVFSSNSSLCGGFNGNVIKMTNRLRESYRGQQIEVVATYTLGKKAAEVLRKANFEGLQDFSQLLDHPSYGAIAKIAAAIMEDYMAGKIDKVEIIYHHYKSAGTQILMQEQYLPIQINTQQSATNHNYLIEPSAATLLQQLVPTSLYLSLFTAMLNSLASEHAARVIAMQVATDNADDLLQQLTLQYNKTRQQAITAELLDIVGGSMA
ncbi:MAG: F0F1 ATP synthase subunit gamma [Bacteroidaceae bacterium]|nr:F0F1 ATP synthase subunit gamma [Bacteroidaceae bacterium]